MITIGLIDDHDLFRASLKQFLSANDFFLVTIEAENGLDFFKKIEYERKIPDVVITDYQMPKMNGRLVVEKLKEEYPTVKTIVLSVFEHEHLVNNLIQIGASGFLCKSIRACFLNQAIQQVVSGKLVISTGNKFEEFGGLERKKNQLKEIKLTTKQLEFLKLCALPDLTYKEIADYMHISPKTADRYREELFRKLGINSRAGLLLYAIETGLYYV